MFRSQPSAARHSTKSAPVDRRSVAKKQRFWHSEGVKRVFRIGFGMCSTIARPPFPTIEPRVARRHRPGIRCVQTAAPIPIAFAVLVLLASAPTALAEDEARACREGETIASGSVDKAIFSPATSCGVRAGGGTSAPRWQQPIRRRVSRRPPQRIDCAVVGCRRSGRPIPSGSESPASAARSRPRVVRSPLLLDRAARLPARADRSLPGGGRDANARPT